MAERYVFVFIRQDIPVSQQIVQSNHATLSLASLYPIQGTPNIVVIGVPNEAALRRAEKKLEEFRIPYFAWIEPDFDLGFTAITTLPLDRSEKAVLANYRVYSPVGLIAKSSLSKRENAGVDPAGRTNAAVAQSRATRFGGEMEGHVLPAAPNLTTP